MKHVMNKNVNHNGKMYEKGMDVSEDDVHFKMLHDAGHIASSEGEASALPVGESQAEEAPKPKGKRK